MPFKSLRKLALWKKRRRLTSEDYQSEGTELKEDEACRLDATSISMGGVKKEESYCKGGYYHRISKMSPPPYVRLEELESENPSAFKLFQSIYQGNVSAFEENLKLLSVAEINSLSVSGHPLLHLICFRKDIDALSSLLELGVEIDARNCDGITPLHIAINEGWVEGVYELLSKGASADIIPAAVADGRWPWVELPILSAARNGDLAVVSLLLEQKPDLTCTDLDGNTILHLAASSRCPDLIERLTEKKVVVDNISFKNNKCNSPLHSLMLGDDVTKSVKEILECTNILLQHGAQINSINSAGKTPLFLAARANLPLVVEALLHAGANPTLATRDGRTVLHASCRADSYESLKILLGTGKMAEYVTKTDNRQLSPFHFAVLRCSINCCELLLSHGDHLTNVDHLGRSRCSLVLQHMPSAMLLLKRVFDAHIVLSDEDIDDPDYQIDMDFNVLLSNTTEHIEASLVADFNGSKFTPILKHPLVESFLFLKWHKIKCFYYLNVLLYFLFLVVHTLYIIKTYKMNTDWSREIIQLEAIHWFHVLLLLILMIPETLGIVINLKNYIRQWETYFKFIALGAAAFVVFTRGSTLFSKEVSRNVAALSIFFTWVEFMMLLGQFPSLGVYILMFTRVAKSVITFLLAFSPLIIAFALSFSILFESIDTFQKFPTVFVKTLMMMIGEIDFGEIYEQIKIEGQFTMIMSQIFLVAFLVLIPVLMANLLIGLAVSDLPDLQLQGKIRRLVKEASYLESYERMLFFFGNLVGVSRSLAGRLSSQGSIPRKITIFPNLSRHKNKVHIPDDAVKAAVSSGTKEASDSTEYLYLDFKDMFRSFYEEYIEDRDSIQKALDNLNKRMAEVDSSVVVDGKPKSRSSEKRKPMFQ